MAPHVTPPGGARFRRAGKPRRRPLRTLLLALAALSAALLWRHARAMDATRAGAGGFRRASRPAARAAAADREPRLALETGAAAGAVVAVADAGATAATAAAAAATSTAAAATATETAAVEAAAAVTEPAGAAADAPAADAAVAAAAAAVPRLSAELVRGRAKNNLIIVTWANAAFLDFVVNWAARLDALGVSNYLVGAMDAETAAALAARGAPVFAMFERGATSSGLTTGDLGWGSPSFHKMGRQKFGLAAEVLGYGVDACLVDVDTAWVADPTPYFASFAAAGVLASSDRLFPSTPVGDAALERADAIYDQLNIGLLFMRATPNVTAFVAEINARLDADAKAWDQNVFNDVLKVGVVGGPPRVHADNDRLVWAFNASVVAGVLPVASFASGHTFFVQRLHEVHRVAPFLVHCTFQFGATPGKRHRLREAALWHDAPEYYGAGGAGRFLSFDLAAPEAPPGFPGDLDSDGVAAFHLAAMRPQLAQVRAAAGLAAALNRTLVLPPVRCFADRYWAPLEKGRVPGAKYTRLPFVCPADHWLEPAQMESDLGPHAPRLPYREHSFLDNPRTPAALAAGRVDVRVDAGAARAEDIWVEGRAGVRLPPRLSDAELVAALGRGAAAAAQLLHFTGDVTEAWGGFAAAEKQTGFEWRVRHALGVFCCRAAPEGSGREPSTSYYKLLAGDVDVDGAPTEQALAREAKP